jgi:hypothetical protein
MPFSRTVEQMILASHQGLVKAQQGAGLQDHRQLAQAFECYEKRKNSQYQTVPCGKPRRMTLRTFHDQQLLFDRQ